MVRATTHLCLYEQVRALTGRRWQQVYTFGESDTYWTFTGLASVRMWFNKYKIPMAIFFGRWWLPVLPRKDVQLLTYVGEPLVLPKIESPSAADVEYWHGSRLPSSSLLPLILLDVAVIHARISRRDADIIRTETRSSPLH